MQGQDFGQACRVEARVAVVASDSRVRDEVATALERTGVTACSWEADGVFDCVVVWPYVEDSLDRHSPIDEAAGALRAGALGVVVWDGAPDPLLRLRCAEVGFTHGIPLQELLGSAGVVIWPGAPSPVYRLPDARELREAAGLDEGRLTDFLARAREVDPATWTSPGAQSALPVPRSAINRLRRDALEIGGLPAPSEFRFSTAIRSAPQIPEWSAVRALVRSAWGIEQFAGVEPRGR